MSAPLDPTPRTPEEAEALERARASMAAAIEKLGPLPEGVEIDFGFADGEQTIQQIGETDAAIFVTAKTFTRGRIVGTGLPVLPIAHIDGLDFIRDALIDGEVTCNYFGMVAQIAGGDIPLAVMFRLVTRGVETPLYVTVADADDAWRKDAMHRMVVAWPQYTTADGVAVPYIATGPMRQFETPLVVDPKRFKGRNSPCPCGSGLKSKKCCFR
jgi:hypothetical protein